jgi:hypothetical protein
MLHVSIDNKCLTIKGECGQTFVTLHGIQFLTNQPKVKEIEYAVALFHKFLNKHQEMLIDFVEAKKRYSTLTEPEAPEDLNATSNYSSGRVLTIDGVSFRRNTSGAITITTSAVPFETIQNIYSSYIEAVEGYYKAFDAYEAETALINEKRVLLTKCDI